MQNMKTMRLSMAAALLAACCATTFAAGQAETPPADAGQDGDHGPHGGPGEHAFRHMASFRHLQLSEAQQDKLFAIHHAAEPQHRQQEKAVRHAHEALRALREASQFDEAKAGAAARDLGQAIAAEEMLQARVHAQALAVLTPEQREQLRARRAQRPQDRP
jgi:Spy/CpxP family protein refolding chaperone